MKLTMWSTDRKYERALGPAMCAGAAIHGDAITIRPYSDFREPEGDGGIILGVVKRDVIWAHQAAKAPFLFFDKGFTRERRGFHGHSMPTWWRFCWNDVQPTFYLMEKDYPPNRMREFLEVTGVWDSTLLKQRSDPAGPVVILGSSEKFHDTMRLPHPTIWAQDIQRSLAATLPNNQVIYRPKPSWAGATAIDGAAFDAGADISGPARGKGARTKTPYDTLRGARCSITYGSNACVDSILAGIPCVVLGNAVAQPISKGIAWPDGLLIDRWLSNLTYHQWTPAELEDGTAWPFIKEQLTHAVAAVRRVY